ncbi:hypothetical protein TSTA_094290 [Talaromyces stipitatus ATCC 10500]|uniref:Zn(2)-C6 fungal-type domain-containing protein n=1 Tax=Talaromyces stipitatus (strain ATCC 10500 / CBS 375.48 / QM 6759 / NRRL 1006) TaxID=441959 RepID=B8M2S8_TALSN|nr:uncharacterized protein TSTA_094290 [Talaromyces stipitatus ATCC 10500]EED22183.1 hypothetical protein TSTA_094290 [Talaromyces stipitatus ATCC 10500]
MDEMTRFTRSEQVVALATLWRLRIRKVKCDERYPVCHRCSPTGRTCDEYGVWGGGNQSNGACRDRAMTERFDWFEHRTSTKLRGSFDSEFWTRVILQTSVNELAVRHAVLAVSFVHRRGSLNTRDTCQEEDVIDHVKQVPLRYFAKSIDNLQPHLLANSLALLRVVLITCIAFTTLDLLRGHFDTARIHVRNDVGTHRQLNRGSFYETTWSGRDSPPHEPCRM